MDGCRTLIALLAPLLFVSSVLAMDDQQVAWLVELRGTSDITFTPTFTPSSTPSPTPPINNRIKNPGAEEPYTVPYQIPYWTTGGTPPNVVVINPIEHVPVPPARSGNNRFGAALAWQTFDAYMYQEVEVSVGHVYAASFWISHMDGTDEDIRMLWIDGRWGQGPEQLLYQTKWNVPEPNWTLYDGASIIPNAPVITIVIRYRHIWPSNKAGCHVDDIALIGPDPAFVSPLPTRTLTPTRTPTHTLPPALTWTPTPTVPALGSNLLLNADFEAAFVNGVASQWQPFAVGSGGRHKENAKLGRIGGGVYGARRYNVQAGDWDEDVQTIRLSAKTHLVDLSRFDVTRKLQQAHGDDVIVVGKLDTEAWLGRQGVTLTADNARAVGRNFANYCLQVSQREDIWPHCYYGLNEPGVNEADQIRRAALFELGMTERLHELGLRACVLNNSTGTPSPIDLILVDEVRQLFAVADYVGYHCYGGPQEELMCAATSLTYFSLRWRMFASRYDARYWRYPAVIYTEATTWGGWVDRFTPTQIRNDLICMDGHMKQDPWSLGLNIFVTGAWNETPWTHWDISQFHDTIGELRHHNMNNPVDARSGVRAQQVQANGEALDRGIVQAVATTPGAFYILRAWYKLEWFHGYGAPAGHAIAVRFGFDPTGQTATPDAPTVQWTPPLTGPATRTDIWFYSQATFQATGSQGSVWLRAAHPATKPSVRVGFDDVSFRRVLP